LTETHLTHHTQKKQAFSPEFQANPVFEGDKRKRYRCFHPVFSHFCPVLPGVYRAPPLLVRVGSYLLHSDIAFCGGTASYAHHASAPATPASAANTLQNTLQNNLQNTLSVSAKSTSRLLILCQRQRAGHGLVLGVDTSGPCAGVGVRQSMATSPVSLTQ